MFFFKWVICRFQPFIFQGVMFHLCSFRQGIKSSKKSSDFDLSLFEAKEVIPCEKISVESRQLEKITHLQGKLKNRIQTCQFAKRSQVKCFVFDFFCNVQTKNRSGNFLHHEKYKSTYLVEPSLGDITVSQKAAGGELIPGTCECPLFWW